MATSVQVAESSMPMRRQSSFSKNSSERLLAGFALRWRYARLSKSKISGAGAAGLGDEIDKFGKVAAEKKIRRPNGVEGFDESDFAEGVHRALAAAHIGDLDAME